MLTKRQLQLIEIALMELIEYGDGFIQLGDRAPERNKPEEVDEVLKEVRAMLEFDAVEWHRV